MLSFENTEYAFAYKTDSELKRARFLFSIMGKPWLVSLALKLTPPAIKMKIPFTNTLIRNTIFRQFVGGETLEETAVVADKLEKYNVQVILDYGVEGGVGEKAFDESTGQFINVIKYAASQRNIPFMSIKVTGIIRFGLLEKLDTSMHKREGDLMDRFQSALYELNEEEKKEWARVEERMERICLTAEEHKIGVLVDAEESWIQDPVDALTMQMMEKHNKQEARVYNTMQLYRHDRLAFVKKSHEEARAKGFFLGAKLVRGAYMEKERDRAKEMNYPSPIQPDKASTDRDYDAAVKYCLDNIEDIAVIVASHNENSNMLAIELLKSKGLMPDHPHVHFSQLFGMSDNITFNLARHGSSVSKYLPFGPIKDVIPYLMRRAQENTSVAGQTGRELGLIHKELQRRHQ